MRIENHFNNFIKAEGIWKDQRLTYASLFFFGLLIYLPFIGNVHLFDWDEINFAESAREMILTGDYSQVQINFKAFWEKPPLFIWLQALSFKIFGVNEWAARFPNVLVGCITLCVFYKIGKGSISRQFSLIWIFLYAGSILPHFYFRSGIIDPLFNLFIFLSVIPLAQFDVFRARPTIMKFFAGGIFCGLAVLTKGPVAILVLGLTWLVVSILTRSAKWWNWKILLAYFLGLFLIAGAWFAYEIFVHGFWFVEEFITYQIRLFRTEDAGHGGPWFYHPLVLLLGCFPLSILALPLLFAKVKKGSTNMEVWMQGLFWVHLILFTIVKTKIVHYSSLCYLPMSFLAAKYLWQLFQEQKSVPKSINIAFLTIGSIWTLLFLLLPIVGMNADGIMPYVQDKFARANLGADVIWPWYTLLPGFILLGLMIYTLSKSRPKRILFLSGGMIVILQLVLSLFVGRIEAYSQNSLVEFYKERASKKDYVHAAGFKSYGQYFYTNRQEDYDTKANFDSLLVSNTLDKDLYFVVRNYQLKDMKNINFATRLYEKNGFVFFKRPAVVNN